MCLPASSLRPLHAKPPKVSWMGVFINYAVTFPGFLATEISPNGQRAGLFSLVGEPSGWQLTSHSLTNPTDGNPWIRKVSWRARNLELGDPHF